VVTDQSVSSKPAKVGQTITGVGRTGCDFGRQSGDSQGIASEADGEWRAGFGAVIHAGETLFAVAHGDRGRQNLHDRDEFRRTNVGR